MLYLKKKNLIHLGGFHLIEETKYITTNYCAKILPITTHILLSIIDSLVMWRVQDQEVHVNVYIGPKPLLGHGKDPSRP